ncbi:MAG: hypothetical protein ABJL67_15545 [Sulfitobacter sp.]
MMICEPDHGLCPVAAQAVPAVLPANFPLLKTGAHRAHTLIPNDQSAINTGSRTNPA